MTSVTTNVVTVIFWENFESVKCSLCDVHASGFCLLTFEIQLKAFEILTRDRTEAENSFESVDLWRVRIFGAKVRLAKTKNRS